VRGANSRGVTSRGSYALRPFKKTGTHCPVQQPLTLDHRPFRMNAQERCGEEQSLAAP